jgi:hypothetical protein
MKQKRNNKQKDILFIFISSFVVVVAWIGFNLYHIYVTSTISQDIQIELTPINPLFDSQTMQQLSTRENIDPLYDAIATASDSANTPAQKVISPTPEPVISETPATEPSGTQAVSPSNSPINRLGQ